MREGNKWYFFSRKTQSRVTANGYWKALGVDEPVFTSTGDGKKVGMKKHYGFYIGESPAGTKTNWIMQEYSLSESASTSYRSSKRRGNPKIDYSAWVLCRVFESNDDNGSGSGSGAELSCLDEVFLSLDDLEDISLPN
ncbi:hypothetical protein U1Q18_003103 [Sarracenia purpurea var. burkii]